MAFGTSDDDILEFIKAGIAQEDSYNAKLFIDNVTKEHHCQELWTEFIDSWEAAEFKQTLSKEIFEYIQ